MKWRGFFAVVVFSFFLAVLFFGLLLVVVVNVTQRKRRKTSLWPFVRLTLKKKNYFGHGYFLPKREKKRIKERYKHDEFPQLLYKRKKITTVEKEMNCKV